jgi:Tol biopolymer transport system component
VTSLGTVAGVIPGTAAYMSPEQARGRSVDRRADLWALGAVLYEMLTGKAPFDGETVSDTLASVLKTEPDWDALPPGTPPGVRRLLRRCLEKKVKQRLHDAADARIELTEAFDEADPAVVEAGAAPRGSRGALLIMTAVALIGGAVLGFVLRGGPGASPTEAPRIVSTLAAPDGVTVNVRRISLALSPDGDRLVFVGVDDEGRSHLYVRSLDANDARRLDGTEGAETPFWSHDGGEIGYHSGTRLMRVPVDGGTPQIVTELVAGRDGTWNRDGTILVGAVNSGPLVRVEASGDGIEELRETFFGAGCAALTPQFLPDGRRYIFQVDDLGGDRRGIYLGELGSTEVTRLVDTPWNASYGDGQLLYVKDDMLVAQPLDVAGRRVTGEPRRVAGPVLRLNYPFHGFFATASAGDRLVYLHGSQSAGLAELVWVDRAGNELERTGIRGDLYNARLSKDGRRVALDISTAETHGDIWIHDLARGSSRRLTRDPIDESRPSWTPDERRIVFFRIPDLYTIDAIEGAEAQVVYSSPKEKILTDVSPDGRQAMFFEVDGGDRDLRVLDLESGEARDWLSTEYTEMDGRFSPDGRWVAYVSLETGAEEVWVDRFPERGERFRISTEGGSWPIWRRDGKELFYFSGTQDIMAVPLAMDSESSPVGTPQKLFSPRLRRDYFDVTADGQRFLLTERIDPVVGSVTLIQGWAQNPGS